MTFHISVSAVVTQILADASTVILTAKKWLSRG